MREKILVIEDSAAINELIFPLLLAFFCAVLHWMVLEWKLSEI